MNTFRIIIRQNFKHENYFVEKLNVEIVELNCI